MGSQHSEETRERIRQWHLGRKTSEETKKKLSLLAKKRPPMSEETKRKIGEAGKGRPVSEKVRERIIYYNQHHITTDEDRIRLSELAKRTKNRRKPVLCLETGEIFESARAASAHLGVRKNSVCGSIHAGCACCGFHFQYLTKGGEPEVPITETKVRAGLVLPKELKAKLEELAASQNRSFNNLVVTILENYIKSL